LYEYVIIDYMIPFVVFWLDTLDHNSWAL